jgi:hypothetical protein
MHDGIYCLSPSSVYRGASFNQASRKRGLGDDLGFGLARHRSHQRHPQSYCRSRASWCRASARWERSARVEARAGQGLGFGLGFGSAWLDKKKALLFPPSLSSSLFVHLPPRQPRHPSNNVPLCQEARTQPATFSSVQTTRASRLPGPPLPLPPLSPLTVHRLHPPCPCLALLSNTRFHDRAHVQNGRCCSPGRLPSRSHRFVGLCRGRTWEVGRRTRGQAGKRWRFGGVFESSGATDAHQRGVQASHAISDWAVAPARSETHLEKHCLPLRKSKKKAASPPSAVHREFCPGDRELAPRSHICGWFEDGRRGGRHPPAHPPRCPPSPAPSCLRAQSHVHAASAFML